MRLVRLFFAFGCLLTVFVALCAASIGLAIAKREGTQLPDHLQLSGYVPALASQLKTADGVFLAKFADENRKFVPYRSIPKLVVEAFISAEDRNYWKHAGVDWIAVARAAVANARERSRDNDKRPEGGSTITQQVAKNLLVGDERSMKRKIREALVAMRLDKDLGKERVLEIYLNEVYLGSGSFGVAAAAETYFGKPLDRLDVSEAALLAGLPKAPSAADPFRRPERARERRAYVLRRMADDGKISQQDAERLAALPIVLARHEDRAPNASDWFVAAARRSLQNSLGREILTRGGFQIATTLRTDLQQRAEAALRRGIVRTDRLYGWRGPLARMRFPLDMKLFPSPPPGAGRWRTAVVSDAGRDASLVLSDGRRLTMGHDGYAWTGSKSADAFLKTGDVVLIDTDGGRVDLQQMPIVEGALAAVDPKTGNVVALVGGFSREQGEFDRATQAKRQPGSSFKTFVYLTAVTIGYDPSSPLLDVSFAVDQGPGQPWWRPAGYGASKDGLGMIPMRRALELSRNMASARLLYDVGVGPVGRMVRSLGLEAPDPMPISAGLGALETTPLIMASAYAAIANGGRAVRPKFVTSLEGPAVPKDLDLGGLGRPVATPVEAALMQSMLRGVVERGTARKAFQGFPGWIAGKTGTTNDSRDAWFVAIGTDISIAVWIGRDDNKPLPPHVTGGSHAAPIVRDFLESAGKLIPLPAPQIPPGAVAVKVDADTGLRSEKGTVVEVLRATAGGAPPAPEAAAAPRAPAPGVKPEADGDEEP